MRPIIDRTGRDFEDEPVVVRVDFSDDAAWQKIVELLNEAAVSPEWVRRTHFVDDAAFSGASSEEAVQSILAGDPKLEVVFLADAATMKDEHLLLAVSTGSQEPEEDEEILSPEFRLPPNLVHEIHVNLAIGHLDFWEYSYYAARAPGRILQW